MGVTPLAACTFDKGHDLVSLVYKINDRANNQYKRNKLRLCDTKNIFGIPPDEFDEKTKDGVCCIMNVTNRLPETHSVSRFIQKKTNKPNENIDSKSEVL